MSSLTIVLIVRALFGSCPSAKNGRGDKDMAENNVGSAEQYEDSGRWRWIVLLFNQTINVSFLLLVCFVLSCFYYMLSICICIGVCACLHGCIHVMRIILGNPNILPSLRGLYWYM